MASKINYIAKDKFESEGIFQQNNQECTINNLAFRRGDVFAHHQIKDVLDVCNKYNGVNINTLIVKSQDSLTVWIEEKSKSSAQPSETANYQSNSPVQSQSQGLPTKKVTKRYRGREYEEEVVDWAAVQQMQMGQQPGQQNKERRKYRGHYID